MAPKRGREPLRPALPARLLDKIGGAPGGSSESGRSRGHFQSRKDRRKEERVQKRQRNVVQKPAARKGRQDPVKASSVKASAVKKASVTKGARTPQPVMDDDDDDDDDEENEDIDDGDDFGGFSEEDSEEESEEDEQSRNPAMSKAAKDKLARDDAEIAELEKKLGIKKKKGLPKSFHEDGLDDILGELADEDGEDEGLSAKRKRKAEADEWLAAKRRKAMSQAKEESDEESEDDMDDLGDMSEESGDDLGLEDGEDDDDLDDSLGDDDDLEGLEGSDSEEDEKPVRKRENPYVAPVAATAPAKYVPPARRQETGSDAELLSRIRRQTQGLINRLTESNLVAILGDVEKLYREHARQHVTSTVVDLLLIQICEPTSLPDTLLILNAGFSTALYKVVGPDFGAQLIQHTVEKFKEYYAQVPEDASQNPTKHTSNLITFLAEMYNFQLIGCNLMFDYIRFLLDDLSELNAELLLRVVRMAGQNLRQDDPLALKDIVALIRPAVKKVGEANLSVRTKFMIESINDLKNNKVKAGASASAVIQDHTTRMKKLLGSLNSRKLKATEPLRIGLKDIEESDKRGKWWLVGASWAGRDGKPEKEREGKAAADADSDSDADSIILSDDDEAMPDLAALAREQNMNTDVRRSIFIAIMSAQDYEDAYARITKLRLNKHRQKEIAYVVMQCACVEQQYNPYYSLVAKRLCSDGRVRFAFQDSLWKFFRRLGESTFGEDADEDNEDDEDIDTRRVFNLSKMFGFLVANGAVGLSVLKCLSLVELQPKTRDFVEVMLITLFLEVKTAGNSVAKIFQAVADLQGLSKGLQYFLRKVRKSDLVVKSKEKKAVRLGCEEAVMALTIADVAEEGTA